MQLKWYTNIIVIAYVHGVDSSYTRGIAIGGYRVGSPTFAWLDGSQWNEFDKMNWSPGEPNDVGEVENIAVLGNNG